MAQPVVNLDQVSKYFASVTAVDRLSVTIPHGTIFGLLGPNGAGKTTCIRMVVGILRPDQGTVRVFGADDPTLSKSRLGYLPEDKGLYKKMRVQELVAYFGQLKGLSRGDARRRAADLLDRFELGDWCQEKCESLSKGMAQKVQIAATLVHEPELVVLDEPFSGLDPVNVELIRETILAVKQSGRSVILSTHIMEQAEQICDQLVLINHGTKVLEGTMGDLKRGVGRTIALDYDGDGSILQGLAGVLRVNDAGKHAELTLDADTDPQQLLAALVGRLTIRRFDTQEASLHEIFIRAVRPDSAAPLAEESARAI
ncbi:MAG: ATP-binding cassette domain-containing protein [Gammaproteobacteria bacterium]|nr:MAG: ATP-binding cassette domain-containing protein [Gammaproteobacteria bacterium]